LTDQPCGEPDLARSSASRRSQVFGREAVMHLTIGQKVAYPNQGVCIVENIKQHKIGDRSLKGYCLRVLNDNSTIFVPEQNAENIGIRPLISSKQCRKLIDRLSEDFDPVSADWKTRSREFTDKLRSGDVFQVADVFKMLTFLSHEKRLSFREQTLLEKAKFLIISEIRNTCKASDTPLESEIVALVESACFKHSFAQHELVSAAAH
jgi:CarD family transcriptional regulator